MHCRAAGCVYGGLLTACVIPPLRELQASKAFVHKLDRGEPLTLQDLQGSLVSVQARQPYAPPKGGGGGGGD